MPELPEIEIAVRRIEAAAGGAEIESAMAPGMNTMKTFDPPLDSLAGRKLESARRRGKLIMLGFGEHTILMHLMQGGRIQLHDKRASMRDRTARRCSCASPTAASCACASSAPSSARGRSSCRPTPSRPTPTTRSSDRRPARRPSTRSGRR